MVSKVNTLAPTDGIKDPQVRAFCDSLANVWQLRNGDIGFDDKERFITKQEWDYLAKNPNIRALAGVGQEGANANQPGQPGTGTAAIGSGGSFVIPDWIQNLIDFLSSGITLIDFNAFKQAQGDMWTTIYRLTSKLGDSESGLSLEIQARTSSDTALATQLNKLWAQVGDANPANALVSIGATVEVNNFAATAVIFNNLQSMVTDPNTGNVALAAIQQQFTTYVNLDQSRALSSYSLIAQAGAGGVEVITGMSLTAEVLNGAAHSAVIFWADNFGIYNPDAPNAKDAPFFVSGGKTRIAVLYIKDYLRSDIFARPGETVDGVYYRDGIGWLINANGDAEFYGFAVLGKLMSGSIFIDKDSKQWMTTTAVGAWYGSSTPNSAAVQSDPNLVFYGPGLHNNTFNPANRVRVTVPGEGGNGIPLVTTLEFSGVADHFVTLWYRYNGGAWSPLNVSTEPGTQNNGYGSTTCFWSGLLNIGYSTTLEFGVSSTDANGNPFNHSVPTQLRDFAMTAKLVNI
jgi:hypothetical protein